ncbi:SDR family oxidoreductase [Jiangella mangrovi]|uniref:NAD(P)-dependent dehydrogenase (Short-subunit alcohol dehydrogenase family) n=1 Tax=Jiangella mangrovi TaxID=1524084 RepID=A0A7W9GW21_9ACTN|nr:NAD(P)-dependent dehydrogenase (short-subunit alcohol dehydrogenase family) [Jiangella mangrovi]
MTRIEGTVALVTGGNRGLGKALVSELLARGASKVYAAARTPSAVQVDDARVVPLRLDVTSDDDVRAAAEAAGDVSVLVNNAGALVSASFLDSPVDDVRREFETNFYGPLRVTRAFVPVIAANGGGHVLNVHSVLSWLAISGSYSASKAALWSQTNSLRLELRERGIGVTGLHSAYIDTDMAAAVDAPKSSPADVARLAVDAVEAGQFEVLVDDVTRGVKAGLAGDVSALYPQLAAS